LPRRSRTKAGVLEGKREFRAIHSQND
jgi:hypothetical protein